MSPEQSLIQIISPFIRDIANEKIDIYNEFSLQHELGIFLRNYFVGDRVQFERNVKSIFPNKEFIKREIDIAVLSADQKELKWAIELKYPRNGQHPEQMYSFCRDVVFAEELKIAGFHRTALIIFAEDDLFWRGSAEGIYGFFRGGRLLNGKVQKPTGRRDNEVVVRGNYTVVWETISEKLKFVAIDILSVP